MTTISPFGRGLAGGQSSWSRLFARLQIEPSTLLALSSTSPSTTTAPFQEVPQPADILLDGAKISYGLQGAEFAALLILAGFSPSAFALQETRRADSHLGTMYVGPRELFAFEQVAQLDAPFAQLGDVQNGEGCGRYTHAMDVRHCIDLAMGVLRFDFRGKRRAIVVGAGEKLPILPDRGDEVAIGKFEQKVLEVCFEKPSSARLTAVRRNLMYLTGRTWSPERGSLYDIPTAADFDFDQVYITNSEWQTSFPALSYKYSKGSSPEMALQIAIAVQALKPWGIMPVLPRTIPAALMPILSNCFPIKLEESKFLLASKFRTCPVETFSIPGWTYSSMSSALDYLQDTETHGFGGLSSKCTLYYDAMLFVFGCYRMDIRAVETQLAVKCAVECLSLQEGGTYVDYYCRLRDLSGVVCLDSKKCWREEVEAAVVERLTGSSASIDVEPWACEILAVYMHAWLSGSKHIEENFRGNFRRRVFLG